MENRTEHRGKNTVKLELLMSCMGQTDDTLVRRSQITGDVVVVNQCDCTDYREYRTAAGCARIYSVTERGLCRSRNMAIAKAQADICQLCDDDEVFVPDYAAKICAAYESLPQADVIIFKMTNRKPSFPDKVRRLRFPMTAKVSSWQISFRRERLLAAGVRFNELMGAGSGNGAEEELKFLLDCQRAKLKIYYVPAEIASVAQSSSTWFHGFDEAFFEKRGATTRYVLGPVLSRLYALYYVAAKRGMYGDTIAPRAAWRATLRGIRANPIAKQEERLKQNR